MASSGMDSKPTAARGWPPPGTTHERQALRLREGGETAAGRHAHGDAAARARLRGAGERLLGLARVAHHDDQRLGAHPLGERVPAHHRRRYAEAGQAGEHEVGADGGAAHSAHGDAARLGRRDGRERPEERAGEPSAGRLVAFSQLPRETGDLGEHAGAVDLRGPRGAEIGRAAPRQPSRMTERTRSRFSSMSACRVGAEVEAQQRLGVGRPHVEVPVGRSPPEMPSR